LLRIQIRENYEHLLENRFMKNNKLALFQCKLQRKDVISQALSLAATSITLFDIDPNTITI